MFSFSVSLATFQALNSHSPFHHCNVLESSRKAPWLIKKVLWITNRSQVLNCKKSKQWIRTVIQSAKGWLSGGL